MSLRTQRSRLAALILIAWAVTAAGCTGLVKSTTPAGQPPEESGQTVLWETITSGVVGGNLLTGQEYLRLMRPVAVAVRGPLIYIVDDGLNMLLRYHRDSGDLEILKDLRRIVSGTVTDIYVASDLTYYLADYDGGRVLHYDRNGNELLVIEDKVNLGRPVAVVVDEATGYIYIADGFNDDVLVYNRAGLLAGAIGERGEGPGRFLGITAFALGPDGYYVATRYGETRVQVMAEDGRFLKTFQKDALIFPISIAVGADRRAFVGDYLTDTIKVFEDGRYVYSLGRSGTAPGQFKRIADLWLEAGYLYVADSLNGRIQVLKITAQNLQRTRTPVVE